ncbi:MAG: hypothetical protein IPK92_12115 [Nitrospira sp.]|nr:hypothetical protein [Nitrospira sp.]MBL8054790.1 hypothetical protein [Nitrospira sp.]
MKYVFSAFKLLSIAFLAIFLHGCIGIGFSWHGDRTTPTEPVPNLPNKKRLVAYQGKSLSAHYVLSQWGEPDHRGKIDSSSETWEYRGNNLRWHGLYLLILLPLPLIIPFGHDYVTIVIQDGQVRSAAQTASGNKFEFFCGYSLLFSRPGMSCY